MTGTGRPNEWSPERDDFLVDHINKGWSYLAIAKALSEVGTYPVTRNAVAGRKMRLLAKGRVMTKPAHREATIYGNKHRAKAKKRKEKIMAITRKPVAPPAPSREVVRLQDRKTGQLKPVRPGVLPMTENPKLITELGHRQCRAAVGEAPRMYDGINNPFLFCAARTQEGETYCDDHAFLMYTRPKPKTERGLILPYLGTTKGAP